MAKRSELISDEKIVELFWSRDETAIQRTDEKYGKLLFKIAYNILGDIMESEECRNDAYMGMWNSIPDTRPDSLGAYASILVRNIAINRYKEKTSKKRIPSGLTVSLDELCNTLYSENDISEMLEASVLGNMINQYVMTLSKKNRYIFVGRFYMASPPKDIAKELGVSESTVYKSLDRIKTGLKKFLEAKGEI